jgi:Holliday junction resolvase-like predicted endonuclease
MDNHSLMERGKDAAAAYLERIGLQVTDRDFQTSVGVIPIVAVDKNDLVRVSVVTRRTATGHKDFATPSTPAAMKRERKEMAEYMATRCIGAVDHIRVRYDKILIRVLGDDRALLRHYRGSYEDEDSQ